MKLQRYGNLFLNAIIEYCRKYNIAPKVKENNYKEKIQNSDTYRRTLDMIRQGMSLDEIAVARGLVTSTIASHIEKLIMIGEDLGINNFVSLAKQTKIESTMKNLETQALTPVKEALGDDYSYDEIRIVRAKMIRNKKSADYG